MMTIAAAQELPLLRRPPGASGSPVTRDAAEKVLRYLSFHRSLIGEASAPAELLERYLSLAENLEEGVHIVIDDPFQKATAMLFELVMDEAFDPWEIDLAKFTQSYLDRVRQEGSLNFAVAGRLLYMAWNILYLQSEEVLRERESPAGSSAAADGEGTDVGSETYLDMMETPEAVDVTSALLDPTLDSPLRGMVRHPDSRPVTLLELIHAFGDAEEEARESSRIQLLRDRLREEQRAPPEVLVHGDIPQRDVEDAWTLAKSHPVGEPFPLLELWGDRRTREHLVSVFLAALYLARERSIEFRQEHLMETPVCLVRIVEARTVLAPEAG